ncbi:MAG: AraC family transcriptional regulator [Clostridia bacterium]|nr:AraC family transcriptional regulator [Clostridia bacterium]
MQIFYARGSGTTDFNSEKPLYVNNCGYYRDLDSDITVTRPSGRSDYHLLVVTSGRIFVAECELEPGQIYLFYPDTPQSYRYESGEGSEYYWLHFSGRSVPLLIESYGLREGLIDLKSCRGEVDRIIRMMLRALTEKYRNADIFCEGLLQSLLALIAAPPVISSPYHRAIKLLSDPANEQSIEEIASIYNVSANHFIRSFKQYVGQSPCAYRIAKRIELACEMLTSTDLSVERVAHAVGYVDALYFSRVFRSHMGCTPTEYRRRNLRLP